MRTLIAAALACAMTAQTATASCARDAMLVFDGSASMAAGSGDAQTTRIHHARAALARAMPEIEDIRRIGLLTYGPGAPGSCNGIELRFLPRERAAIPVLEVLGVMHPRGLTPLSAAVEAAAEAVSYRTHPAIVVLVTDGNETCGGTPCATASRMAEQAANLTVHVIGFRTEDTVSTWSNPEGHTNIEGVARCFADRTGGMYLNVQSVDELTVALQSTLGCLLVGEGTALGPRRIAG